MSSVGGGGYHSWPAAQLGQSQSPDPTQPLSLRRSWTGYGSGTLEPRIFMKGTHVLHPCPFREHGRRSLVNVSTVWPCACDGYGVSVEAPVEYVGDIAPTHQNLRRGNARYDRIEVKPEGRRWLIYTAARSPLPARLGACEPHRGLHLERRATGRESRDGFRPLRAAPDTARKAA
jgi:hypothetical protein